MASTAARKIQVDTQFSDNDFRNTSPRFDPEARRANLALVERLSQIAESSCTV